MRSPCPHTHMNSIECSHLCRLLSFARLLYCARPTESRSFLVVSALGFWYAWWLLWDRGYSESQWTSARTFLLFEFICISLGWLEWNSSGGMYRRRIINILCRCVVYIWRKVTRVYRQSIGFGWINIDHKHITIVMLMRIYQQSSQASRCVLCCVPHIVSAATDLFLYIYILE